MRRFNIHALILLIIIIHSVSATDWYTKHLNPEHIGYSPDVSPTDNQTLAWTFTTGDSTWSSPAVANGIVYIGSDDNHLYALNMTSGSHMWNYTLTSDAYLSSPTVYGGKVFMQDDGHTYALDAQNGSHIWTYSHGGMYSSLNAHNGKIFAVDDAGLYVLNADTGAELWNFSAIMRCKVAIANGKVFFGDFDAKIYALLESNGSVVWSRDFDGTADRIDMHSDPTVVNGQVLVMGDIWVNGTGKIWALDEADGSTLWTYLTPGQERWNGFAVHNGRIFFGSRDGIFFALNETDGSQLWNKSETTWFYGSPAVATGLVYIGEADGYNILAYNEETGTLNWSYKTGAFVHSSPAITDGMLFVGSGDTKVYALGTYTPTTTTTTTTTLPSGGPSGGRRPPAERPHLKVEPTPFDIGIPYLRECSTKKLYLTWTGTKTVTVSIRPSRELSKHLTLPYTVYAPANKTITLPVKGCLGKDVLGFKGVVNFYVTEFPEQVTLPVTLKHMKEPPKAFCGNGVCDEVENIWNCPQDCLPWSTIIFLLIAGGLVLYLLWSEEEG